MDKNATFQTIEKFLMRIYSEDLDSCAAIITYCANKDVANLSNILDAVSEFANDLKNALQTNDKEY